jgi:hypothetical protein
MEITRDDLSEAQLEVLRRINNGTRVIGAATGVGKTLVTLYAISHVKSTLVIVPKMLRDDKTWEKDMAKTVGINSSLTVLSKEDFRKQHIELRRFDALILDEAGEWALSGVKPGLRSHNRELYIDTSQIYEALHSYVERIKPEYIFLLDATLLAGKPLQLWAAMDLLGLRRKDMSRIHSHQNFINMFYTERKKGFISLYKERTLPTPFAQRRYLKREEITTKEDAEKTKSLLLKYWNNIAVFIDDKAKIEPEEIDIIVPSDSSHKKIIESVKQEFNGSGGVGSRTFAIENGHLSDMEFDDVKHTMIPIRKSYPTAKNNEVLNILKTGRHKNGVLIFSTFSAQQIEIHKLLGHNGYKGCIINGSTGAEERSQYLDLFRLGKFDYIIVQSSICQGWNTPDCDAVIRISPPIRAGHLQQQYGRIDRKSNYKKNYIYNIILKGGVDSQAFERVKSGDDLNDLAFEE